MVGEREREAVARLRQTLVEALEDFFRAHGMSRPPMTSVWAAHERQLATAALMLQITRAEDFRTTHEEGVAVRRALEGLLGLSSDEAHLLIRFATEDHRLSVPIVQLTGLLNSAYDLQEKRRLLEALWQVAFADAQILAHEEYFIRKVSELLNLSTADLIEAKIKARESFH